MAYYTQLNKCINSHVAGSIEYFDPAASDSEFPSFFCCLRCEHDWVANRLQALTLLEAVDIQARAFARGAARAAAGSR